MTDIALGYDPTGTLLERMRMEVLEVAAERCVVRMPVSGNTQPMGLLHGGASAALAETAASFAAKAHAGADRHVVGLDLSITHHRSARSGYVIATATALHRGRTIASYEVAVVTEDDVRVSSARLTCLVLENA
ncbi:PaaI family thioesterase [Serinibacter salmoneus]|uniref:Uncharacterized protein (TIGR00369 family) n=1 Tax=Serinibacter salmoneus TaxID=556530 RepID=A0A2A9CZ86_9MICO|nr:hotdog fold thioesterase [Serinibacter salmoneus]PFG19744.1 uncharacterized protein (TIGR00369 family) [Serinibacter salmoneus]